MALGVLGSAGAPQVVLVLLELGVQRPLERLDLVGPEEMGRRHGRDAVVHGALVEAAAALLGPEALFLRRAHGEQACVRRESMKKRKRGCRKGGRIVSFVG
jgi:hypothetical protein